jgi:hypothetical protein
MTVHTLRALDTKLGKRPGFLANEFYCRRLPDSLCVFVGGKRAIEDGKVQALEKMLRDAGRIA